MLKPPPAGTRRGHEALDWNDIRFMRDVWKGRLLLKGILAYEDARLAAAIGIDGVIVSNHGGRQLDGGLAPLHALPAVVDAAGDMAVLFDGGVRRGGDVIKALALGARMVFVGRPFLYGAVVGGEAGVERVAAILDEELDRDLALLGCPDVVDLAPEFLASAVHAQAELRPNFRAQRFGVADGPSHPLQRSGAS
jgi:L-lactate dehydrogenase (cytochrome)